MLSKKIRLKESDLDLFFGLFDTRNITALARRIEIPAESVRKRIKRIFSSEIASLKLQIKYECVEGLKRSSVFCSVDPNKIEEFEKIIREFPYWESMARYASKDGHYLKLVYPEKVDPLEKFKAMERDKVLNDFDVFPVEETYPYHPNKGTRFWFDVEIGEYKPQWKSWIEEIRKTPTTLNIPVMYRRPLNDIKLKILEAISEKLKGEKLRATFVEIGKDLHITPQDVRYHYNNYLKSILEYKVILSPNEKKMYFVSVLECTNKSSINQIINSRGENPFLHMVQKLGTLKNTLVLYFIFPPSEYENIWDTRTKLITKDIVKQSSHSLYLSKPESNPYLLQNLRLSLPFS